MTNTNVSLFSDLRTILEQSEPISCVAQLQCSSSKSWTLMSRSTWVQPVTSARVCGETIAMGSVAAALTRASVRSSCRSQKCVQSPISPFLTHQQRSEAALISVVQQAYVNGISTRKIEALVKHLGVENLDKSAVSRMCSSLDEHIQAFRARRIDIEVPYLFLDATYLKVRQNQRIVSHAVFIGWVCMRRGRDESSTLWDRRAKITRAGRFSCAAW